MKTKNSDKEALKTTPKMEVFEKLNAFKLPKIMPPQWDKTVKEHIRIAYDPSSKQSFHIDKEDKIYYKDHPFKNLITIKDDYIQGTKTPAISRLERYHEIEKENQLVIDENDKILAPCLAHGDYVEVALLQSDHIQPKADILKRQQELVEILNNNPDFAEKVMALRGMDFSLKQILIVKLNQMKIPKIVK